MKIENVRLEGLREILWEQIRDVKAGKGDLQKAAVIIKAADSIISSYKMDLAIAQYTKKPLQLEAKNAGEEEHSNAGGEEGSTKESDGGMAEAQPGVGEGKGPEEAQG